MKRLAGLIFVVLALSVLAPVLAAEAQGLPTVFINHKGRVITIPLLAVPRHLLHGDSLDVCRNGTFPPCPPL